MYKYHYDCLNVLWGKKHKYDSTQIDPKLLKLIFQILDVCCRKHT
jgi:hypothetical protein